MDREGSYLEGRGYHAPVLVREVLDYLDPKGEEWIVDGTVGGGGHARAVLERCPGCRVLGVDRDPDALEAAKKSLGDFGGRVRLVAGRFDEVLDRPEAPDSVSGVLLDLGVSSHQIDSTARGFTFREGAPLDMRMEGAAGKGPSAADLLNHEDEATLTRIFRDYGEERRGRALARRVVRRRTDRPFMTSDDLVAVFADVLRRDPQPKEKARIFQALRIAVNEELRALEESLPRFRERLGPAGRIVVISYHSLEDRIVKNAFREWSRECVCPPALPVCRCRGHALGEVLTRKPVMADEEEVMRNPRSRSARLRAWRKAA